MKVDFEDIDGSATGYCRKLVAEGIDPNTRLDIYRGDVLCLKIRSIGEAAKLTVKEDPYPHHAKYKPFIMNKQVKEDPPSTSLVSLNEVPATTLAPPLSKRSGGSC